MVARDLAAPALAPGDLVELGAVRGAYGLKGWVRITPFAADGAVLESVRCWWLLSSSQPRELAVQEVMRRAQSIFAKWAGCDSKEAADALKGGTIAVARSDFPVPGHGEHYLNDVVGYCVVNRDGVVLGTVSGVRTGAASQWLEVGAVDEDAGGKSLLIPWVDQYVDAIETEAQTIRVDWQSNW